MRNGWRTIDPFAAAIMHYALFIMHYFRFTTFPVSAAR